jgi:hypothetical protein
MTNDKNAQVSEAIKKLENKEFSIYFFVLDTKGNPNGALMYIYEHAKMLRDQGLNAVILTEKNDYTSVSEWLGEEYSKLPHVSIESQTLKVGPQDFLVIPEIFANVMEQTKNMPCKRIVFCQSYDYILEILNLGAKWTDYGIKDCITTSEKQKAYINEIFPVGVTTEIVPIGIPDYFKVSSKPQKPVIAIYCRDPRDTGKIVKTFYLKYPQFKWVTFRDMKGIPRKMFADSLSESCLSVWVDPISGFGTFPLESMKCGVPVVGRVPNIIPEWMEHTVDGNTTLKENGMWTYDTVRIPDLIATFVRLWLEDNIPQEVYNNMLYDNQQYNMTNMNVAVIDYYNKQIESRKLELQLIITQQATPTA